MSRVRSAEPPSTTTTSWPRRRKGAAEASVAGSAASSSSAGMITEILICGRALAAPPGMEALERAEQPCRRVRTLPDACRVLVRLGEGGIDVDRAEDLVQADAVLHRRDVLGDQLAGVL